MSDPVMVSKSQAVDCRQQSLCLSWHSQTRTDISTHIGSTRVGTITSMATSSVHSAGESTAIYDPIRPAVVPSTLGPDLTTEQVAFVRKNRSGMQHDKAPPFAPMLSASGGGFPPSLADTRAQDCTERVPTPPSGQPSGRPQFRGRYGAASNVLTSEVVYPLEPGVGQIENCAEQLARRASTEIVSRCLASGPMPIPEPGAVDVWEVRSTEATALGFGR